jgi:nicotinamidase-related amidase
MASPTTALLLIDPYNDFLHPKGKVNEALAESIHHTQTIPHLLSLVKTVRKPQIPIFYCQHQQFHPGQYKDWQFMTASQQRLDARKVFEEGSWGAEIFEGLEPDPKNGEVVVAKHWNSRLEYSTSFCVVH